VKTYDDMRRFYAEVRGGEWDQCLVPMVDEVLTRRHTLYPTGRYFDPTRDYRPTAGDWVTINPKQTFLRGALGRVVRVRPSRVGNIAYVLIPHNPDYKKYSASVLRLNIAALSRAEAPADFTAWFAEPQEEPIAIG
jgi:hypothetical protein